MSDPYGCNPPDESSGRLYEHLGISVGTTDETSAAIEVIGIEYPTGIGEEVEPRFMTLPCAKALLIDLRDAIEAAEHHQRGEPCAGEIPVDGDPSAIVADPQLNQGLGTAEGARIAAVARARRDQLAAAISKRLEVFLGEAATSESASVMLSECQAVLAELLTPVFDVQPGRMEPDRVYFVCALRPLPPDARRD